MDKFAILGGGLAGCTLWLKLYSRGIKARLYDSPELSGSSRIAAGLINPVVLKRFKIVHNASQYLSKLQQDCPDWEQLLHTRFYHPRPIRHLFFNTREINQWVELSDKPSHSPYLGEVVNHQPQVFSRPYGYGIVKHTAWLDTLAFINAVHSLARQEQCLNFQQLTSEKLKSLQQAYDGIFICTGHLMRHLLPETAGAFSPTRGEVMIIESSELPQDAIYHGPVFILPLGNKQFKVGATYHWDNLQDEPTPEGLMKLRESLEKFYKGSYRVVKHLAGVRPNTQDRKPLLGAFSNNLISFNGLGSRGALMAPFLADHLLQHLIDGQDLEPAYNIRRFYD